MRAGFTIAILALVWSSGTALAADVVTSEPAKLSVPVVGDDLKNCAFITHDCEVCTIAADGKSSCSSTGIACTPTKRTCLIPGK